MKFMINPKFQYIMLIFYYPLIGTISALNFAQAKKDKHAIFILISIFVFWLMIDQIIPIIISDILKIDLYNLIPIPRFLYSLTRNIIIGGFYIWDQKKNIDFIKLTKKEV